MQRKISIIIALLTVLLCIPASAQLWSGIISPTRAVDWSTAGNSLISESRPCNVTLSAGATAATIQNAINAAPAHTAVCLNAGTYNNVGGITWHTNYVTLRGAGASQTLFTNAGGGAGFYNAVMEIGYSNISISSPDNVCGWAGTNGSSGTYTPGATSVDLSSCVTGALSNLKVGSIMVMDQLPDGTDTGQIWNCAGTPACAYNGDGGFFRGGRLQEQTVTVANCTTASGAHDTVRGHTCTNGTGIVISSPVHMPNWTSGKTPQAWFPNSTYVGNGVEDLSIDTGGKSDTHIIAAIGCDKCWISGTRLINAGRAHIGLWVTTNTIVRDNYLYFNQTHNTVSYGIELAAADQNLIANNIIQQSADSSPSCMGACEANVFAYNYAIYTYYAANNWMTPSFVQHAAGDAYNLWEGNVGNEYQSDDIHGTHHFNTLYRNYINGWQAACWGTGGAGTGSCTGNVHALSLMAASRYYNVVGNVLGKAGFQNSYNQIYDLGAVGGYTATGFCQDPPTCSSFGSHDPSTALTLFRWGNYDTVTNAIRWCGNSSDTGWAGACSSTTEVPATLTSYANSIPSLGDTGAGQSVMPPSFYLSASPSWWNVAGQPAIPWPAVGPDVSSQTVYGSSGSTTWVAQTVGGHAAMIPATLCYKTVMNGPADGSGNVLTFNASSCYASGGGAPPPVLTTIVIAPTSASLVANGATQTLTAACFDQTVSSMVCPTLTWNSDTPLNATVNSSGVVSPIAVGTAHITATASSVTSNQSTITVAAGSFSPPPPTGLLIIVH